MTAGRGISHSERTPAGVRESGGGMFGIQSWIALPQDREEMAPLFEHFDASSLPTIDDVGVRARVIAGSVFGQRSPVGMVSEWFYAEVLLDAGASAPLDSDHEERAIYVAEGEVDIAGDKFTAPQLLVFRPGDRITVTATQPAHLMFLGGAALEGPRYLWWNFVSSRKERIEEAKQEWKTGRFALIPGDEREFIPLPEN
jgi:redox-sensitive bicupin YhaK (pirin superfamily)